MAEKQQLKSRERVAGQSPSLRDEFVAEFCLLTPHAFTEDLVDFAKLRESVGEQVDDRPDQFSFTRPVMQRSSMIGGKDERLK